MNNPSAPKQGTTELEWRRLRRFVEWFNVRNGVIGAVAGVLGLLLALIVYLQATASQSPDLKPLEFVIDTPQNVASTIKDVSDDTSVGTQEVQVYPADIVVQNTGDQAAVISKLDVVVTGAYRADYCSEPIGGGGDLYVVTTYDFSLDEIDPMHLPATLTKSTRLEVLRHESLRFSVTVGKPSESDNSYPLVIYTFDVYAKVSGTDERVRLGTGKVINSNKAAALYLGFLSDAVEAGNHDCVRKTAGEIHQVISSRGANSPKLDALGAELKRYLRIWIL